MPVKYAFLHGLLVATLAPLLMFAAPGSLHAQPAYVSTVNGCNCLAIVDTANNSVVRTIALGYGALGVAVNAAGTRAYVANGGDDILAVVDTYNSTVIASVPVGSSPWGVAVNPAGTRVYVANNNVDNVSVIETTGNTVIASIPVGTNPRHLAVTPDGTLLFVTNFSGDSVSVIDTGSNSVIATVPVGSFPEGIVINAAGTFAYVANRFANSISVIDTGANAVIATVPVGAGPRGVAIDPAGARVYVANQDASTVSVIETTGNTVVATLSGFSYPLALAVNPAGTRVFIANEGNGNFVGNNVIVIATATNAIVATIAGSFIPQGVAFSPTAIPPFAPVIGIATAGNGLATVSFTPPAFNGGSPITGFTATCNPGTFSAGGLTSPIMIAGLANDTAYTCAVTATNSIGSGPPSATAIVTPAAPALTAQTITFPAVSPKVWSDAPFTVSATASSGLPVTFSATPVSVCTLAGNSVTLAGITGTCSIAANQAGDANYAPAPQVVRAIVVDRMQQIINLVVPASKVADDTPFIISATSTSGLVVTLSVLAPSVCSLSGATVLTLTGTSGACNVAGDQAGNPEQYYPATQAVQPIAVNKASQSISIGTAPILTVNGTGTVTASATSGLPVTFSVPVTAAVCSVNAVTGVVTGTSAGTCTVAAGQSGDGAYADATQSVSFAINANLTGAVSRKSHGAVGAFDLPIDLTQSIGGAITVEPRAIGGGHTIVFNFDGPITAVPTVAATDENGAPVGTVLATSAGNDVVVTLAAVPNNKRVTVLLPNVNTISGASASLALLVGDVNGTRAVSAVDVTQSKAHSGQVVDTTNFQFDLNSTGTISAADISAVKNHPSQVMPAALTVGGTISGANGYVVLRNNFADSVAAVTSGAFTFPTAMPGGGAYSVTVQTEPTGQNCSVANGAGVVAGTSITNVAVTCTTLICLAGFGNCDGQAANGCETDLNSNTANCGQCGNVCSSNNVSGAPICGAGKCTSSCNAGFVNCSNDRGCACLGTACCGGGACQTAHANGVGQSYFDCASVGTPGAPATYTVTRAFAAAATWPVAGTISVPFTCAAPSGQAISKTGTSQCAVWAYSGSIAGHVNLSPTCLCPGITDPTWN